jgi:hypothetical protein
MFLAEAGSLSWYVLDEKLTLEAVIGVLGVLVFRCLDGGVWTLSSGDVTLSSDIIFAAVGVLSGRRLIGGSRSGWSPFLPTLGTGLDLKSVSETVDDLRGDVSGSLGVSRAAIASASDSTVGLTLIGVST